MSDDQTASAGSEPARRPGSTPGRGTGETQNAVGALLVVGAVRRRQPDKDVVRATREGRSHAER
jgi:hypothetical protein